MSHTPDTQDLDQSRLARFAVAIVLGALTILILAGLAGAAWPALAGIGLATAVWVGVATAVVWRWEGGGAPQRRADEDAHSGAMGEAMIQVLPEPVLVLGRGGRVQSANRAARFRFGLDGEGMLLSSIVREPDLLDAVAACEAGGAARDVPFMALTPREEHLRAFVAPLETEDDAPPGMGGAVILVLHDETALKRAERLRLDFLANASHELRTPLTSLAGFIETLRGPARSDPKAHDKFLSIMESQTARMRSLIDDLLSLSRIEQYEHVPPTGVASLRAIAEEVAGALAPLADEAGVVVTVEAGAEPAEVDGARDELLQVAQNLVENAIKYSQRHARVRIRVGVGHDREAVEAADLTAGPLEARFAVLPPPLTAEGFGWLSVADNGPGIARRHLPRLGERFFRVRAEDAAAKTGTGLGLAISKHILNRHRGGLLVASQEGEGTTFTILAPRSR